MRSLAVFCAAALMATPAIAQDRETLGYGRLFSNDYSGDNQDRWRTGAFAFSIMRGSNWTGDLATTAAPVLEYRLRSEIIAPSALDGAGSDDRVYVGALSAGIHAHFAAMGGEVAAGLDLVATGPQTGLTGLQNEVHKIVGATIVSDDVIENQLQNAFYPTASGEFTYPVALNPDVVVRPFVQAQVGIEDILRVGADVMIMDSSRGDLWVRDSTTGQLYQGIDANENGTGFVFGMDYAVVGDSAYFPASFGTVAEDERMRVRAGVHAWFGQSASVFYGVTYLSEEYVGQPEGQVVGSIKLDFNF